MTLCRQLPKRIAIASSLFAMTLAVAPAALAQTPPQSDEDQQLEKLLSGADLVYKMGYNEEAQRWEYLVKWSQDGDTSLMPFYIRPIATTGDGKRVCAIYCWTLIVAMPQGEDLPPAAIKAV